MTKPLEDTIYGHLTNTEALALIKTLSSVVANNLEVEGGMVPIAIMQGWDAGQACIFMRVGRDDTYTITDTEMAS